MRKIRGFMFSYHWICYTNFLSIMRLTNQNFMNCEELAGFLIGCWSTGPSGWSLR